jgi:D-glycero-D-manno-heptose 1,7-bisphosphate phosphatase
VSKLIVLDRDGVINFDSDAYIKSPAEWVPIPGSVEAIARLVRADYRVVVVTNQSGVARGLYDLNTLAEIHDKMHRTLETAGGRIDAIFFCPHGPEDGCHCRKPQPGLLAEITERTGDSLVDVPMVGDSLRDIQAARAVGGQPILVRTGNGSEVEAAGADLDGVAVYDDLAAYVAALLATQ